MPWISFHQQLTVNCYKHLSRNNDNLTNNKKQDSVKKNYAGPNRKAKTS